MIPPDLTNFPMAIFSSSSVTGDALRSLPFRFSFIPSLIVPACQSPFTHDGITGISVFDYPFDLCNAQPVQFPMPELIYRSPSKFSPRFL